MTLARAFRKALEESPCSLRALAREAGVDHSLLVRVRDGDRPLTPATVQAVVTALRRWGERCESLADELEATLRQEVE
jgi:hypothetical protein